MNRSLALFALVLAGCGPQWPSGTRVRTNLCELAATVDSFTLATVEEVHAPQKVLRNTQPSEPAEFFWGTRVDWSGERLVAARGNRTSVEARFSTVYSGNFTSVGTFIIGRALGTEWVDLHADVMFSLGEGGWRRSGHTASELNVLEPALADAFTVGEASGCENWAGGDQ
ncbi:MAG: hypothetical protein JNM17_39440 [Archangium sp.]|nr:hypothetical protein [Archangium sp.]